MLNRQFKAQPQPGDQPSSLLELLRSEGKPFRIPVVLCGKTEKIGQGVIEGLKPEFSGKFRRKKPLATTAAIRRCSYP